VRDVAAKGVKQVKIWLGDRSGTCPAMPWQVCRPSSTRRTRPASRCARHDDPRSKDALRAGIDALVHMVQNAPIDETEGVVRRSGRAGRPSRPRRSQRCVDNDPFFTSRSPEDHRRTASAYAESRCGHAGARLRENLPRSVGRAARLGAGTGIQQRLRLRRPPEIAHWFQLGLAIRGDRRRDVEAEALGLTT
jgi:hypothetical protein